MENQIINTDTVSNIIIEIEDVMNKHKLTMLDRKYALEAMLEIVKVFEEDTKQKALFETLRKQGLN